MENLVSQEIVAYLGLIKIDFKIPIILDLENVAYIFVNVGMSPEEQFYIIKYNELICMIKTS